MRDKILHIAALKNHRPSLAAMDIKDLILESHTDINDLEQLPEIDDLEALKIAMKTNFLS